MTAETPLLGIACVIGATLFFAVADVLTKHLTGLYPVPVIIAVRYIASLAILLIFVAPRIGARLWQTKRIGMVIFRGLILSAASLTMGLALRLMPVGETIAILYLSPFAVMLLASPLLGERVTPIGWFLSVLGFGGVLMILRPGGGLDPVGVIFALTNASCATVFLLMTRVLGRTESSIAMLFHVSLVGAVVFSLAAIPSLGPQAPAFFDLGLMALLGLFATVGHFLLAVGYSSAPASLLAPINYVHLVWAGLLGWLVFAHVPDGISLSGMALVAASGVLLTLSNRREARAAALPGQPR